MSSLVFGPKQSVPRVIGRFIIGWPLDGRFKSDATFMLPATKSLVAYIREPSGWQAMPYWKRAAIRHLTVIGIPTIAYICWKIQQLWEAIQLPTGEDLRYKLIVTAYFGIQALGLYGYWLVPRIYNKWRFKRTYVVPVQKALTDTLGEQPEVTMPLDFHTNENSKATISLPVHLTAETQRKTLIEETITAKLGAEYSFKWNFVGRMPRLSVYPAPNPPLLVPFSDIRKAMLEADPFTSVIGLGPKAKVITWSVGNPKSTAVHMLISAATGGGKSTLSKLVIAQWLACGGIVIICDIKRVSHMWARGLPGVIYCRSIEDIHMAQIAVADECDKRFDIIEQEDNEDAIKNLGLPPILMVNEEFNVTMARLRTYWQQQKESKRVKISPGVEGWSRILFTGRQARVHALGITQMGTVRAVGGTEIREQFTDRALMNYSPNAAKMLCPDVILPPSPRNPGSGVIYNSSSWDRYQIGYINEREAIEWVLAGQKRLGLTWPKFVSIGQAMEDSKPIEQRGYEQPAIDTAPETEDVSEPVTLSQAIEYGILTISIEAARKAAQRDPEFPESVGKSGSANLYDEEGLRRWTRNRTRVSV
jgi:hypothetical protein